MPEKATDVAGRLIKLVLDEIMAAVKADDADRLRDLEARMVGWTSQGDRTRDAIRKAGEDLR